MSNPIIYIDESEIRESKLHELQAGMAELAEFVESQEPQLLAYQVYFNEEHTRVTVIHVHPDADSLDVHMNIGGPRFARFSELLKLEAIDVLGEPSSLALAAIRRKAESLGTGKVGVHRLHAGFARFSAGGVFRDQ
jgi:quinol monooxygenase YgiN